MAKQPPWYLSRSPVVEFALKPAPFNESVPKNRVDIFATTLECVIASLPVFQKKTLLIQVLGRQRPFFKADQ